MKHLLLRRKAVTQHALIAALRSTVKDSHAVPRRRSVRTEQSPPTAPARSTIKGAPLSRNELDKIDAYWRASLYLCMGMIYLKDNPLLRKPLKPEHVKARLLGHWGSDAGSSLYLRPFQPVDQQI